MSPDQSMKDFEQVRIEREMVRHKFGSFFTEVSSILFEIDPVGINFETNTDEYEPEVGTILPRLHACKSLDEVRRAIHQEFIQWFGKGTAGIESHYQQAAERIWDAWQKHLELSGKS
jgi:hypothetical protein